MKIIYRLLENSRVSARQGKSSEKEHVEPSFNAVSCRMRGFQQSVKQRSQVFFICLLAITTLAACSNHDDHNHPNLKTGQALFNHHCAECHGEDGTGHLAEQTPANILTKKGHQGIIKYVTTTINPDRQMPVFATMPYSEAMQIANHLLTLRRVYDASPNSQKKPRPLLIEP